MSWRYVIMANGRGLRWGNHLGIPKHLITVHGETLVERLTRQVLEIDPAGEVVISSSDARCVAPGARRHSPERNEIELDRFVPELIQDQTCFLYGDTFYTDGAVRTIVDMDAPPLCFCRTAHSIVAVKSADADHLLGLLDLVREAFLRGDLEEAKGRQLLDAYLSSLGIGDGEPQGVVSVLGDSTGDFNVPADLYRFSGAAHLGGECELCAESLDSAVEGSARAADSSEIDDASL